jgi:hypothetical protein
VISYIPKLARITSGRDAGKKRAPASPDRASSAASSGNVLDEQTDETILIHTLSRLAPRIRQRLAIKHQFSDEALLASLLAITRHSSHEKRWRAAEASTLGQYLASSEPDMHRTLVTLLSLLPKP